MALGKENNTILKVLEDFGNEVQEAMKKNLGDSKALASGDLFQSINFSAKVLGSNFKFQLKLADYYEYVDQGVSGTKKKRDTPFSYTIASKLPVPYAKKFIQTKGILRKKGTTLKSLAGKEYKVGDIDSQAYAMAVSWKRFGTKGNNFYSKVITDERVERLIDDLRSASATDVRAEVLKGLNTLKET